MIVCPVCDGSGIKPGTGITFTASDLDEAYGDDYYERREGARAWSTYGQRCDYCHGRNVVTEDRGCSCPVEDVPGDCPVHDNHEDESYADRMAEMTAFERWG